MPRKATGTIIWAEDHWRARIRLADGSRPRIDLPAGLTEVQARKMAADLTRRAREQEVVKVPAAEAVAALTGETVREWSERWLTEREDRGLVSVKDDRGRVHNHVLPALGDLPIQSVPRARIEALVEDLDAKVRTDEMSWRTACHVWGAVTKMFADATNSKNRALRVRGDDPTQGVRGPDRGEAKSKVYLYPSEFLALATCPRVPLRWRHIYTLATYLCLRAGELEALDWADLDLEHETIHVHHGIDRSTDEVKGTKTGAPRRFRFDPAVLPLLQKLSDGGRARGLVVRMPPVEDLAQRLRAHLGWAGVTRADLFVNDATRKWITFHDLRATGITWMAVRGDEPLKIKHRAGHAAFVTTEGYIREAENVRESFGDVFPNLPSSLLEWSTNGPRKLAAEAEHVEIIQKKLATPTGIEPVLPA